MIESHRQLTNTKAKLQELEELYICKAKQSATDRVHALTLRFLKQWINQFKEEITRFEIQANGASPSR